MFFICDLLGLLNCLNTLFYKLSRVAQLFRFFAKISEKNDHVHYTFGYTIKHYIDIVVTTCGDYYIIIISSLNNSFTKSVFVVENLIKNHRNY